MANNTTGGGAGSSWWRELTPVVAVSVAFSGSAWVVSDAIGELKAAVVRNTVLIENNAQGIENNAQGIENNAKGIAELKEAMSLHIGEHGGLAAR